MSSLEVWLAVLGVTLLGLLGWSAHERTVGENAVKAADAKALVAAEAKAAAETAALQAQVNAAQAEAANEQTLVNQFINSHPIGPVSVCHVAPSGAVSKGSGATGGAAPGASGTNAVPTVSAGTAGPDISGGLTTLVSAAARLAELEREWQQAVAPK
jgi:hypothetical protein